MLKDTWTDFRSSLDLADAIDSPSTIFFLLSFLLLLVPTPVSSANQSMLGIVVAAEHRCSPYDRQDYAFPKSLKLQVVESLGSIFSPYTEEVYNNIREVDLDHIVALTEAHDSGLCAADMESKRSFSADLLNVTLAPPTLNRSQKMGHDASRWLPEKSQCWFARRVVDVKTKYSLTMDRAEADVLSRVLQDCRTTDPQLHINTPSSVNADKNQTPQEPKGPDRLSQLVDAETNAFDKYLTKKTFAFIVVSLGGIVIIFGIYWTIFSKRRAFFEFKIPGTAGMKTNAEGLAIMALGTMLIIYAMQFYSRGEENVSTEITRSYLGIPYAYAQTEFSHESIESDSKPIGPLSGWVYLGPSHDEKKWNFDLKRIDASFGIVLMSTSDTSLWDRKFDAFTGTFLEGIVGVGKPERLGMVHKGACVRLESVQGFDEVALVELWMKVEMTQCD